MYINTYLDRIGDFIRLCMEFVKTQEGREKIEQLSERLRDPDIIEDMFVNDLKEIKKKVEEKKITEKNAIDNFNKLRVYVLTQLEKHYDLINELLGDTEKKVDAKFTRFENEFPERLREDIMRHIDDAEREIKEMK